MRRMLILLLGTGSLLLLADEPLAERSDAHAGRPSSEESEAGMTFPGNAFERIEFRVPASKSMPVRRRSGVWVASVAALIAANAMDAHSSWRYPEGNGLLRGADGTFGPRALWIKSGLIGGVVAVQWLLTRHRRRGEPILAIMNFGAAAATTGAAVRNYRVRRTLRP